MAVTAQTGTFSWGAQAAKGTIATEFFKHFAADIDLAPVSDDRLGAPEIGGDPVPTFPYRGGVMVGGGATINPRLQDTFGWLLTGVAGACAVATDKDVTGATVTGFNHHSFTFSTVKSHVPFMTFQKVIPGNTTTEFLGEQYQDCKIVSMAIACPNDGPISVRLDVLGRKPAYDDNPSYTYENTQFEDYKSVPVASVEGSYLKVPAFSANALPITQATITLANQPLDVRQEKNFGSPYLDDVTIVGRQLTVDMILKWTDPQLYLDIITGSTTGTTWTASPWVSDLKVLTLSSGLAIDSPVQPFQFMVEAPAVMYQLVGGIRLAGNGAVMMRVQGTAIASTGTYYTLHLGNERTTAYTFP